MEALLHLDFDLDQVKMDSKEATIMADKEETASLVDLGHQQVAITLEDHLGVISKAVLLDKVLGTVSLVDLLLVMEEVEVNNQALVDHLDKTGDILEDKQEEVLDMGSEVNIWFSAGQL